MSVELAIRDADAVLARDHWRAYNADPELPRCEVCWALLDCDELLDYHGRCKSCVQYAQGDPRQPGAGPHRTSLRLIEGVPRCIRQRYTCGDSV